MKVYPKLWVYESHSDGLYPVKIYVYDGKSKYIGTDISLQVKDWDPKNRIVKRSHPLADIYNAQLSSRCNEIERKLRNGDTIESTRGQKSKSILDLIAAYRLEVSKGLHSIRPGTDRNYQALQTRLTQYCQHKGQTDLHFDEINQDFYNEFWAFLHTTFKVERQGFSKHIKNIKKFMNLGIERKLHASKAHQGKEFKIDKRSKGNKVYLTAGEIKKLEEIDLSALPSLERERDRFLLNYYLLLRFDDGAKIEKSGIIESGGKYFYSYVSGKTSVEVMIPIKPAAMTILEKYNYKLPTISNQVANRIIKQVASVAGINSIVKQDGTQGIKSAFVSSHTARRSAATNLYLDGISLKIIAQLGGWTHLDTLKHYLLASGIEVAMAATEYDFFK